MGRNNPLGQEGWVGTILYDKRDGQKQSSVARGVGRNNPLGHEVWAGTILYGKRGGQEQSSMAKGEGMEILSGKSDGQGNNYGYE